MDNEVTLLFEKTIPAENHDVIPMEFVCGHFGINYESEYKNLKSNNLYKLNIFSKSNESLFGDRNERGHLDRKGFIRWILQFNPKYISDNLKEEFQEYQLNIVDYLFDNANQQEAILKKAEQLKKRREAIYNRLYSESELFIEYIHLGAEVARLGKDNKIIQQKIAGNPMQVKMEFMD